MRPPRYIDPLTDLGMKQLFSPERKPDTLMALLNALLPDGRTITRLKPLGTEKVAASVAHKTVFFDLACEDEHGNVFVVEVQRILQATFRDRLLYYGARQVERLVSRGQADYEFPDVVVVALLDYAEPGVDRALYNVNLTTDTGELWTAKLAFTIVNLGNFTKPLDKLVTPADDWMYLLKNLSTMTASPPEFQEAPFDSFISDAEYRQLSPREKDEYDAWWDDQAQRRAEIKYGMQQGIEQGIQQGLDQGRQRERVESVERGHAAGLSVEQLSATTGLPLDRVRQIITEAHDAT